MPKWSTLLHNFLNKTDVYSTIPSSRSAIAISSFVQTTKKLAQSTTNVGRSHFVLGILQQRCCHYFILSGWILMNGSAPFPPITCGNLPSHLSIACFCNNSAVSVSRNSR
jgi:hypothetical protein